jgi:2-aminoadipate transaminase
LKEFFPPEAGWTHPKGGLFLWVTLPPGMSCNKLFDAALKENVVFVPGDPFYAKNGFSEEGGRHLRLNFSNAKPEQIREGIRRLAVAMKQQMEQSNPTAVKL